MTNGHCGSDTTGSPTLTSTSETRTLRGSAPSGRGRVSPDRAALSTPARP